MKSFFGFLILLSLFFILNQQKLIKIEGVYKIKNPDEFLCFDIQKELFLMNIKKSENNLFRIKHIENKINNTNNSSLEDNYYYIEEIISNKKLGLNVKTSNILLYEEEKIDDKNKLLWKFIPSNKINNYYIQNKYNSLFLGTNNPMLKSNHQIKINCSFKKINNNNIFSLSKIFEEISNNENSELLKHETIDLIINYHYAKKEKLEKNKNEERDELKYAIRSIIQNIPWINRIYILLYNDNISFMKDKEEIKEKIIFIKIKDLLGYETDSNSVINFNLFKMKNFNISDNFILMNDNNFIGKPLNKSLFFYEENGKILPAIISNKYEEIIYDEINNDYKRLFSRKNIINIESSDGERFSKTLSLKLLFDSFQDKKLAYLIIPQNNQNLIPLNIKEINDIYDLITKNYKFYEDTLFSKEKNINSLDFYILIISHMKNINKRKVSLIPYNQFSISDFNNLYFNKNSVSFPLFSIFYEKNKKYSLEEINTEKNNLKLLFPNPTKYEVYFEEMDSNEKKSIKKRITNIINNIKKFGKLNYDYGKKRRMIYRKNHTMKRKINNIGKKTDEMMKIIPKLEKYISNLDDINLNKIELINKINDLEKNVNFVNQEFNEIIEYNSGFFTLKRILMMIIVIFVFFVVGFGYYKAFLNTKFDINYSDDDEFNENENGNEISNYNNEGNNNFNSFYGVNEEEKETTKLKEIII